MEGISPEIVGAVRTGRVFRSSCFFGGEKTIMYVRAFFEFGNGNSNVTVNVNKPTNHGIYHDHQPQDRQGSHFFIDSMSMKSVKA